MEIRILRPIFEDGLEATKLPVEILWVSPEGNETPLTTVTLERREFPDAWERESLLENLVAEQIELDHRHLILDLGTLRRMDSAGLGEIVAARRRATESDGELVLTNLQPRVRELFRRTDVERMMPICESMSQALNMFAI